MPHEVLHDPEQHKFYATVDGHEGLLRYTLKEAGQVDFYSTFVPPELRGQGIAEQIVERGLTWAEAEGYRVVPSCWYVDAYLKRHPRFEKLRA
jgi:predicted GNAT family acetyltransferase